MRSRLTLKNGRDAGVFEGEVIGTIFAVDYVIANIVEPRIANRPAVAPLHIDRAIASVDSGCPTINFGVGDCDVIYIIVACTARKCALNRVTLDSKSALKASWSATRNAVDGPVCCGDSDGPKDCLPIVQ